MIKSDFQLFHSVFKMLYSYRSGSRKNKSSGIIVLWFIFLIPLFAFFLLITINVGYLFILKAELQNLADAGAHAGAIVLSKGPKEVQFAVIQVFKMNPIEGNLLSKQHFTLELGYWDQKKKQLTNSDNDSKINAVRIVLHYISTYSWLDTPLKTNPSLTANAIGYLDHSNSRLSVTIVK